MAHSMTLFVRLKKNTPRWKQWLIEKSNWYEYNYAWDQPIWVIYDIVNRKEIYPGGITRNEASSRRDRLEDVRGNLSYN